MAGRGLMMAIFVTAMVGLCAFSHAYDNNPLQDFCVAVPDSSASVLVNGKICKDPKQVTADDFLATGFNTPANTSNRMGFNVKVADVNVIPGLNTLGVTVMRADFAPNGVVAPHMHPRATEVVVILEGTVYAGFVTSNATDITKNQLFAKILRPGDVFVFPIGHIHFLRNVGNTTALVFVAFNSQFPGVITIPNAVFGAEPAIDMEILSRSFLLDTKTIEDLQSRF